MEHKAANKLSGGYCHNLFSAMVSVITPGKRDLRILNLQQAAVGYGDAVSIAAQVFNNFSHTFERRFAVDDPFLMIQIRGERKPGLFQE